MQTDSLFLLDRNVVNVIKEANAGSKQKGDKQQRMFEFLKSIDAPQYSISPLLSLIEGEHGREDSPDEKIAQLNKETSAVASFFRFALTDSGFLTGAQELFSRLFTSFREGSFDARATYRERAAPLVLQIVSPSDRRNIEDRLLTLAVSTGLDIHDGVVVLFLACLYGNNAAREVLKPSKPEKVYNVLSDIHILPRIGLVKTVAKGLTPGLKIRLLTLDGGLEKVLANIRIVPGEIIDGVVGQIGIRYLSSLFTDLTDNEAGDLRSRLNIC